MRKKESEFTKLAWYLIIFSIMIEIGLGLTYIFEIDEYKNNFGTITLIEGVMALMGLLLLDVIYGKPFQFKPDSRNFKKPEFDTLLRTIVILAGIMLIQVIFFLPLTIRDYEIALAITFAAPAEEVFFRGFLISIFIVMADKGDFKKYPITKKKEIAPIEILGIIISSMMFALLHINYYGNNRLMLAVFASGAFLGFAYWYWKDITACILAHLSLNMYVVYQTFYMVNF